MKYSVEFTAPAKEDLDATAEYISTILLNPAAARRLVIDTKAVSERLTNNPYIYPLVRDDYLARQGFRRINVHNYLLFFVIREETKKVIVERFLYGKRDFLSILEGETPHEL